ncbi:iron-sulfur cluster carrier protein ApbC [Agitococcus lubricus]|uniref:Iron-sulfur cluster carrier protein n=1 Tax=Agitococcus lubricus TaxID=1077255 RepID=A0A2T5IWL0_9GAMM|nr:iron-sulfur cluster carrier protein ApbC [Agitococcus lubricus]PTQ88320.1 ATP-binding protein involved in chromosome partitioning [Agitococcus lubricus]
MSISRAHVEAVLAKITDPYTHRDYAHYIYQLTIEQDNIELMLALPYPFASIGQALEQQIEQALRVTGAKSVRCRLALDVPRAKPQAGVEGVAPIKNVIVVASGKGGVGKSTTAVNLALALAQEGASVGILDADIYGPSQPTMLGLSGQTPKIQDNAFVPLQAHGLQVMSIGFLTGDDNTPVVWRGPKATGALIQLFGQTAWHDLDYLIVDMPPGTGDIQLTLAQRIPVVGSVIVTTPQDIALLDAKKGIEMFRKVNINVLGVVENMSLHICSNCGHADAIFGAGGGERIAKDYQTELLGQLPLDKSIREQTDSGKPTVLAEPKAKLAALYTEIARKVAAKLAIEDAVPRNRIMTFFGK